MSQSPLASHSNSTSSNSYQRSEGFFKGHRDTKIFYQAWERPQAFGHLILTHGQGEHSDCYHRLIDYFADDRWNFFAWDLRGHGRSEGKRGYTADFNDYSQDYEIFLRTLMKDKIKQGPVVLISHSMGGTIQLKFLCESFTPAAFPQIQGQVCSAPLLGVALPVPRVKEVAAEILSQVLPKLTLWNEITYDMLTRDAEVIREFETDPFRHDVVSSRVYLGMKSCFAQLPTQAHKIEIPTLFQISDKDPVVSTSAARDFFGKMSSPKKRILLYGEGARHEIYNDIIRTSVFSDLKKFLDGF